MTLRTTSPSPSHNSATEASGGRKMDASILIHSRGVRVPTAQEKQSASDQMRYQLYLLDRSAQRMSIEDCVAAFLERSGTELAS